MSDVKEMITHLINEAYVQWEANRRLKNDKAITFLVNYLHPNEQGGAIIEASTQVRDSYESKTSEGFLLTTDKRVVFAGKLGGLLETKKPIYKEFYYPAIALVQYSQKSGEIVFHISTTEANGEVVQVKFRSMSRNHQIHYYVEHLQEILDTSRSNNKSEEVIESEDFIRKLERLAKLKKDGVLSEAEFLLAKKKLLGD